jgi:hypothetical protein
VNPLELLEIQAILGPGGEPLERGQQRESGDRNLDAVKLDIQLVVEAGTEVKRWVALAK